MLYFGLCTRHASHSCCGDVLHAVLQSNKFAWDVRHRAHHGLLLSGYLPGQHKAAAGLWLKVSACADSNRSHHCCTLVAVPKACSVPCAADMLMLMLVSA